MTPLDGTFTKIASRDAALGLRTSLFALSPQPSYDPIGNYRAFNKEILRAEAHYWGKNQANLMKEHLKELNYKARITYSRQLDKYILWSNFFPKCIEMYPFWLSTIDIR